MKRVGAIGLATCLAALAAGWVLLDRPVAAKDNDQNNDEMPPVTAGTVERKDVPVFVQGLGAAQAYNSVTVRSRVDGQIMQVLFQEGQDVKEGDRLFQIDPRPYQAALDQATAAKAKDAAALRSAQLDLDRYGALVGKGFQTRQSYDQQVSAVDQAQASLAADQAQIDAAKLNLTYADIRSPITGRTGARLVDIGNLVQASAATSLVSITQIKPIFVTFTVPQEQLDAIKQNQAQSPLTVEAYSNDGAKQLSTGKLTLIDNQVDSTTGTIKLKASFDNGDERLWPGEFVSARLVLRTRKGALTVPAQTVMQGVNGAYVYVIKPDDTVVRQAVQVASVQDGIAVIDQGVDAGARVVVDGQYRLTEGGKVSITQPKPQSPSTAG